MRGLLMIDEIIKALVDLVDVTINADMLDGEIYYHIFYTKKTHYHFDYIKEVEAIARMNNYDMFISCDGIYLYPGRNQAIKC